jgi:hypothetical protein
MQCTDEGIWTIDVAGSRTSTPGRCKVYLSSYEGKLLRELAPEGTGPSGIGVDADNKTIWIGSTYSRENHPRGRKDRRDDRKALHAGGGCHLSHDHGRAAASRHLRPIGAAADRQQPERWTGRSRDDRRWAVGRKPCGWTGCRPRRRRSRAIPVRRRQAPARTGSRPRRQTLDGRTAGSNDLPDRPEDLDGRAHVSNRRLPPAWRRNRDADARYLWESDTNMGAFFKRDMVTGEVVDSIQLPEGSPFPARHVGVEGLHLLDRRHRRRHGTGLPNKVLSSGF